MLSPTVRKQAIARNHRESDLNTYVQYRALRTALLSRIAGAMEA